jgi:hypothetical protein
MKKIFKITGKVLLIAVLLFVALMGKGVFATSLQDSILVTGTQNLVDAIISWLTGIGITVCGGYFIYYVYCLKTNDEGERRRNIQNIKNTLIAIVLITCGLAVIDTILSFYK